MREMQKSNKLPFRYKKIGRWWGKTSVRRKETIESLETEIDILAISDKQDKYIVGECKFKGRPFTYSEYLETSAKLLQLKEKNEFYYYLFSGSGFDEKLTAQAKEDPHIKLVNTEEIVDFRNA